MFNLYVRYDKENTKLLHIEPYDDFITQGTTLDWSNKVDYSEKGQQETKLNIKLTD